MTTPIPQPPAIPLLGNLANVESELPLRSYMLLAQQYGEIYQLNILGRRVLMCNSYALQNELSDDKRFKKVVRGPLEQVRHATGDGLFTAHLEEPNWGKAHRLLMPAFGPLAIRGMYDDMMDVCSQLLLKWERFGAERVFDPVEDFTRLAFDTIALCSMSHRLNSFYTEGAPSFVQAMADFLSECFHRSRRPGIVQAFMTGTTAKFEADKEALYSLCYKIIAERKARRSEKKDLLDVMLNGRDPVTGEGLNDENIAFNLITFLIAGHETTSGTLGFMVHNLLKSPDAMAKLRAEVDSVLGDRTVQLSDLPNLPYLTAVMRETLRLFPPAIARQVSALEDTTLCGGKYAVKAGETLAIHTAIAQVDPKVWGEDAKEFRPERMLDGKFEKMPPNSWQPFGFGMRGCIGRPFAWQEIQLVFASLIQKFDLQAAEPGGARDLKMKYALTIKPELAVRAVPRAGRRALLVAAPSSGLKQALAGAPAASAAAPVQAGQEGKQRMYVLYGSNTGASEAFAQRIAGGAPAHGFTAKLGTLDSAAMKLPTDGPVVIVTASYEGEPPDNAAHFVKWLTGLDGKELEGVKYSVFGCGNRDWVNTFQRIPKLCDETIEQRGGQRLLARGEGDAGGPRFFEAFEEYESKLWNVLVEKYNTALSESTGLHMHMVDSGVARASALRQADTALGVVVENKVLTAPGAPEKRHIEFELPADMSYQAGDYLAILPSNPDQDVRRILARFGLSPEQEVVLSSDGPTSLPVDKPVAVSSILSGYVEISQPATTRDIKTLAKGCSSETTRQELEALIAAHAERVMSKRLSVLDILELYPDIDVTFSAYLAMLPSMRVRQYSISSSPLWNARHATLTVSVVDAPALSGRPHHFLGVGSSFLAGLRAGDRVPMAVRPSAGAFRLPPDPSVPVVMFCAGSGIAPMRGFIQERAIQKAAGRDVGRMLLFVGCRRPAEDFLYSEGELKNWVGMGVVDVRPAFSRAAEESCDSKYVQDRILRDGGDIDQFYEGGAKFYSCGSSKMAMGVKAALIELIKAGRAFSHEEAEATFEKIKGRYATDIFE